MAGDASGQGEVDGLTALLSFLRSLHRYIMTTFLSVITCTHTPNPKILRQTLDGLMSQTLTTDGWEYILVDNASQYLVKEVVDLSWHPQARHVREEQLGLTYARLRGIREARGQVIVFVDDDNILDTDFLAECVRIADDWPMIGAWGGDIRPVFEEPPPRWTRPYWRWLAIKEVRTDSWSNLPDIGESLPCGAGMCVRKSVAEYYAGLHDAGGRSIMLDRAGDSLISGGDTDMAMCSCDIGLGLARSPALRLTHIMPKTRLKEKYLLKLIEGISYSNIVLASFRSTVSRPKRGLRPSIRGLIRYLRMTPQERRFHRAAERGACRAYDLVCSGDTEPNT